MTPELMHNLTRLNLAASRANKALLEVEEIASLIVFCNANMHFGEFPNLDRESINKLNSIRSDMIDVMLETERQIKVYYEASLKK